MAGVHQREWWCSAATRSSIQISLHLAQVADPLPIQGNPAAHRMDAEGEMVIDLAERVGIALEDLLFLLPILILNFYHSWVLGLRSAHVWR